MKAGTLCSGGEGCGIGMKLAGITPIWGIELDDKIAQVARRNGFHVITASLLDIDPTELEGIDLLHASPPCPNFSKIKSNRQESPLDIALAKKIVTFLHILKPRYFTLENVWAYRLSESWQIILAAIQSTYQVRIEHLDFSKLGVPQTRKRMIVRASRDKPICKEVNLTRKAGWYESIEDLIPSLPTWHFAPWQLRRFPHWEAGIPTFLTEGGSGNHNSIQCKLPHEPSMTVTARATGNRLFLTPHLRPVKELKDGCIKRVTPQINARLQTFPDTYLLPKPNGLAFKLIGNACPPIGMQHVFETLL